MLSLLPRVRKFLRHDLWAADLSTLDPLARLRLRTLRLLVVVVWELRQGVLNLQAMGLVYTTLISLVPFLAVTFSVLKAFGAHYRLEPLLAQALEPLGPLALRSWVERNRETVERFLAACAEADKWMRANPKAAAQVATRWITGLRPEVTEAAMQYNIEQVDRRLSANNYRALWAAQDRLHRLGLIKGTFDVNRYVEPGPILKVMREDPDLFADLPPIPGAAAIGPGFVFRP